MMTALTIQHLIDTFSAAHATALLSVAPYSCLSLLTSIVRIRDKVTCTPIREMLPGRCPVAACSWQVHCLGALGSLLYSFSALCTTHCNPSRLHAQGPLYLQRAISACYLLFISFICNFRARRLHLPCFYSPLSAPLQTLKSHHCFTGCYYHSSKLWCHCSAQKSPIWRIHIATSAHVCRSICSLHVECMLLAVKISQTRMVYSSGLDLGQ